MIAKTKKFTLDPNKYLMLATGNLISKQWWYILGPVALGVGGFFIPWTWLWLTLAILAPILYLLFKMAQFAGITRMEQTKMMFEKKMYYEIDARQILMKMSERMGSPLSWENIKEVKKGKEAYLFIGDKNVPILYIPFDVFQNQNGISFTESILKRKELM